jgi:hypothetical protein
MQSRGSCTAKTDVMFIVMYTLGTPQRYYIPEKELRGHSPNFYIHFSLSDLYIPLMGLPILLQENRWAECGNI